MKVELSAGGDVSYTLGVPTHNDQSVELGRKVLASIRDKTSGYVC